MRYMTPRMLVLAAAIMGMVADGAAGEFELKLTVTEPAGVARKSAPARGGIPLMAGTFKRGQEFTVSADGAVIPAQVLPLVVDEKGFLRWVLVDTQVDLAANGRAELTLTAGRSPARPATPLQVADGAGGVTVDTGKIQFTISKTRPFGLFTSVAAGGRPIVSGGEASYTDGTLPDSKKWVRYKADKPENITLEHAGPMRVTLKVTGRFVGDDQSRLRYIARVTAWAGRSDVHVKYSLANSNPDHFVYRRVLDAKGRVVRH